MALGVDGFYFADDWGTETSLLFSPRLWRRFIKPRLAIMYQRVKRPAWWSASTPTAPSARSCPT